MKHLITSKLIFSLLLAFFSSLTHSIAQSIRSKDTFSFNNTTIVTPHIKAGTVYIGISPSAILNEYYAFQSNIEIGLGDNISFASEVGWILGNDNYKEGKISGYRYRPSFRLYSKERNWSYDIFYNYRIAKSDIDPSKYSNTFKLDKTSGMGLGVNYNKQIGNRLITSIGLGIGFGNGYVEYTPKHPPVVHHDWSGFGSLGDIGDFELIDDFRPDETGNYTHPISFFNYRVAYLLF